MESLVTAEQIAARLGRPDFGFAQWAGIRIANVSHGTCETEMTITDQMSRPGGTVAGPILMGIADASMWGAAMTIHPDGHQSVTTDLTTHFLSRPLAATLRCRAEVLKPGRRVLVMRADIWCDDDPRIVCSCQGAYAVPPAPIIRDETD